MWDTRVYTAVLSLPGVASGSGGQAADGGAADDIAPVGPALFVPIDARSRAPAAQGKTPLFSLCTESGGEC